MKLQKRLHNLRDIGNHLARIPLDHCVRMPISTDSICDEKLQAINTEREKLFSDCEFEQNALPMTLTKDHIVTWCFGEVEINEDHLEYFKLHDFVTDAAHLEDVAALLSWEGSKYDKHLSHADRAAADLIRRSVLRGPFVQESTCVRYQRFTHAHPHLSTTTHDHP